MRSLLALTLATATSAFVIPEGFDAFNTWKDDLKQTLEDIPTRFRKTLDEATEQLSTEFTAAIHNRLQDEEAFLPADNVDDDESAEIFGRTGGDFTDHTTYELIAKSNYTKKFFKLVQKHEKFGKLLNSTDANYTLFVPTDEAFEHIPHHHKDKPSDEFVEAVLNYHLGIGEYPASRILFTHTIPTTLKEPLLGDKPQRLRTSVGLSGVRVNLYSKVIAVNFKTKNGIIHAVNRILVPPPFIGREISLFPGQFSTLLLAFEKTDFVKYIHNIPMVGSTVFAPSNEAWRRLGPRANAFLFNTETGKKYLKALLKYQIVPNITLYSDEVYYGDEKVSKKLYGHGDDFHIELPTLLERSVGVDVHTFKSWTTIVLNGHNVIGFNDAVGKNGVIQVPKTIPIPPHRKGEHPSEMEGEISVEELKERLEEYVEEEEEDDFENGEL
ncbi:oxidoreductase [Fusarium subglutinans]|uniref:Oxidoreductase n=1 Tax=Gibberella subglutinans TaxID=42677 RepID=A0A8H5L784_GIBSU|nr:oxidoreductase [Fusarium subglutinans]KAF5586587.1 oxidoreductase [Fusarium subglutinans]